MNRLTKTTKNELDSILKSFGKQFLNIYEGYLRLFIEVH